MAVIKYKKINHSAEEIDDAINSENTHTCDTVSHITENERKYWNAKLDKIPFLTRFSFPNIGDEGMLYVAIDENKMYKWNKKNQIYQCIGSDYTEIEKIQSIL